MTISPFQCTAPSIWLINCANLSMRLRVRLFWGKMISRIIFPQTRMFGSNRKWNFPEIHFLLTKIYAFDPEMILHSHFHFISFPGHAKHRESERKNNTERARERTQREQEKEQHRESKNQNTPSDPANEWEKEPKLLSSHRELRSSKRVRERTKAPIQPLTSIYLTPVTPSSARRSLRQTP